METHDNTARDDKTLFRAWLKEHAGLVYKVARAFTATNADREDLTQEILLQLWVSLPKFEGKSKSSTWIYRLALNTALAWKRSEKRRVSKIASIDVKNLDADAGPKPFESNGELLDSLYDAIRSLPKADAVLVMMYLDDLSYRDMADVLGITEDNVGVKLHRIKKTLAETMKGLES